MPWCSLSPAELLMGRRIRTELPQLTQTLMPKWSHIKNFRSQDEKFKSSQKMNYDRRHWTRTLPSLLDDQPVWVKMRGQQVLGTVLCQARTPFGEVRRNCTHLRIRTSMNEASMESVASEETSSVSYRSVTRSQTGTVIHPPDHPRYWRKGGDVVYGLEWSLLLFY